MARKGGKRKAKKSEGIRRIHFGAVDLKKGLPKLVDALKEEGYMFVGRPHVRAAGIMSLNDLMEIRLKSGKVLFDAGKRSRVPAHGPVVLNMTSEDLLKKIPEIKEAWAPTLDPFTGYDSSMIIAIPIKKGRENGILHFCSTSSGKVRGGRMRTALTIQTSLRKARKLSEALKNHKRGFAKLRSVDTVKED